MANNNLPAHDFAPPWLKIPSYDCQKPVEDYPNHHTSRRDEHCLIRRDRDNDFSPHYFFGSKWDRDSHSGDRKGSFFPSRHSSIDIEDGTFFQPGGHLSKSQPSLLRRPSSRHDFRGDHTNSYSKVGPFAEVNSNGGPYAAPSKSCKNHLPGNSESLSRSSGPSDGTSTIDVSGNNFNQEFPSLKGCENDADQTTSGLNGSVWENPLNAKVYGVSHKIQVFQRPLKESVKETRSRSPFGSVSCISPKLSSVNLTSTNNNKSTNTTNQPSAAIYRALIPAKSTHSKKMGKDVSRPSTKRQTPPLPASSISCTPSAQNMEILVKNPRMRGCNKTHFLKTLKGEEMQDKQQNDKELLSVGAHNADFNLTVSSKADTFTNGNTLLGEGDEEDDDRDEDVEEEGEDGNDVLDCNKHLESNEGHQGCNCENGGVEVATTDTQNDHHLLSSSLEAEQRLLKEMGWKEDGSDDDSYAPLTEDELKEFRDLALKMAEKKTIVHTPTPGSNLSSLQGLHQPKMNWSPKRIPPFAPLILPPNEDEGSWSSTSDSD